jgi:hypothetical protein
MGFNPSLVGLAGERVSGTFMEPRPGGCPHKGLDISSSGTQKRYAAGIYGKVILPDPNFSQWCTIAIQPFNDPTATVQYWHSSSSLVAPGDTVAPWSFLGTTGNCSPTPVPIHLHIQVCFARPPHYPCWGGRDFVDPATWDTTSMLLGPWSNRAEVPGQKIACTLWIDDLGCFGYKAIKPLVLRCERLSARSGSLHGGLSSPRTI